MFKLHLFLISTKISLQGRLNFPTFFFLWSTVIPKEPQEQLKLEPLDVYEDPTEQNNGVGDEEPPTAGVGDEQLLIAGVGDEDPSIAGVEDEQPSIIEVGDKDPLFDSDGNEEQPIDGTGNGKPSIGGAEDEETRKEDEQSSSMEEEVVRNSYAEADGKSLEYDLAESTTTFSKLKSSGVVRKYMGCGVVVVGDKAGYFN